MKKKFFCALKNMAPVEVSLLFQRKSGVINIWARSSQTDIKVENVKT